MNNKYKFDDLSEFNMPLDCVCTSPGCCQWPWDGPPDCSSCLYCMKESDLPR